MKKKGLAFLITLSIIFGLSACGENRIPEMTEEELQAVGEYAAITLMKYDANHRSRLVDIEMLEEIEPEPELPVATEEPGGMKPVDDTPVENQTVKENSYSMEEVMGLSEGITVGFIGYEDCVRYPDEADSDYFAVAASAGRKLLVLRFSLSNISGQDVDVDNLSSGCVFSITINGDYTRRALPTMLMNDMATYKGTIPAGGSQEVVLAIEMEEERFENLSSIVLKLKNEPKTHTIQLF